MNEVDDLIGTHEPTEADKEAVEELDAAAYGWNVSVTVTFTMPARKRGKQVRVRTVRPFWCQWNGCFRPNLVECFFPDNNGDKPDELLCPYHAPKAGFCWGCGGFWAGVESFDFNPRDLCDNCDRDTDLNPDAEEWSEDDYAYSRWGGYPEDYDPAGDDFPF